MQNRSTENAPDAGFFEETLLFDYYGELLTERQRDVLRMHLAEDWSLAEIASELSISRQGVHDTLKKGFAALRDYEEKLRLVEKSRAIGAVLDRLEEHSGPSSEAEEIRNILRLD